MYDIAFLTFINFVGPNIGKRNTKFREFVKEEKRLVATLRYLATGRNYENIKFSTIISLQLLGQLIPQTCLQISTYILFKYKYVRSVHLMSNLFRQLLSSLEIEFIIKLEVVKLI